MSRNDMPCRDSASAPGCSTILWMSMQNVLGVLYSTISALKPPRRAAADLTLRERLAGKLSWDALPLPVPLVKFLRRAPFGRLLEGLPSLLIGALGYAVFFGSARPDLLPHYRRAARAATAQASWRDAQLLWQRVRELAPDDPTVLYELAIAMGELGNDLAASRVMERLAPLPRLNLNRDGLVSDALGLADAHVWLASRFAASRHPEARKWQYLHLQAALRGAPDHPVGTYQLAALCSRRGELAESAALLESLLNHVPRLHLELAQLQHRRALRPAPPERKRRLAALVTALAEVAERFHRAQLDELTARIAAARSRRDATCELLASLGASTLESWVMGWVAAAERSADRAEIRLRTRLAEALRLQGRHAQAVEVLTAITVAEVRDAQLGRAHLAWAQHAEWTGDPVGAVRQCLRALDRLGPQIGLAPLIQMATRCTREARAAAVEGLRLRREQLGEMRAAWALGTLALVDGDVERARVQLEVAYRKDMRSPGLINNLAWCLAHASPPDLARALTLINEAVALHPREPDYRDTRGEILCQLGRWDEALADLLAARARTREPARLLRLIALCYERLGMPALAARHRTEAEREMARQARGPVGPR